jgi:hypothetical protein
VNLFLIYPPIIVIVWQIAEVIRGVWYGYWKTKNIIV